MACHTRVPMVRPWVLLPPFRCRPGLVSCRALLAYDDDVRRGGDRAQEPRRAGSCRRAGRRPGGARARRRRARRHLGAHRRPPPAAAWLRPGGAPRSGRRPASAAARRASAPQAPRSAPGRPGRRRSMGQPVVRGVARVPPPCPAGRRRGDHRRHPLGGRRPRSEPWACPRSTGWWWPWSPPERPGRHRCSVRRHHATREACPWRSP